MNEKNIHTFKVYLEDFLKSMNSVKAQINLKYT